LYVFYRKGGSIVEDITRDHKPCDPDERSRIENGGGRVYQSSNQLGGSMQGMTILGPTRVLPGKLSVSRTFGDVTAKFEKYGGNPKCVVAEPEIHKVTPDADLDFIMMGSDGIFDKLSSKQVSDAFWEEARRNIGNKSACSFEQVSDCCGKGVDRVLNFTMETESMDNISVVVLSYNNFASVLAGKPQSEASDR
jgi:protein phosphatase 2C family protein 2/3